MLTPQERLIKFMQLKASRLESFGDRYFIDTDAQSIMGWSDDNAKQVGIMIAMHLHEVTLSPYAAYVCPFCWYYGMSCHNCSYGIKHIRCDWLASDWERIIDSHPNIMQTWGMNSVEGRAEYVKILSGE